MQRAAVLCLLLLPALLWAAPKEGRVIVSASKLWTLKLTQFDDGRCRFEATRDDASAWTLDKCLASVDDLYFLANDGRQFWVLYPLPEKATGRRKPWWKVTVAVLFDKEGNVLAARQAGELLKTKAARLEVEQLKKHFKWLEGVAGKKGKPPRLTDSGQVEFETLEPKTIGLPFKSQ